MPTFAFSVDGISAEEAASRLGERGFAVWWGNYYALEVMKRLGLEDDGGAVRVGLRPLQHGRGGRPAPRRSSRGSSDARAANGGRSRRSSLVSTALRAWAALRCRCRGSLRTRWSTACSGAALWEHGSLDILGGPTPYYSPADAAASRASRSPRSGSTPGTTCCKVLAGAGDVARGGARVPLGTLARAGAIGAARGRAGGCRARASPTRGS